MQMKQLTEIENNVCNLAESEYEKIRERMAEHVNVALILHCVGLNLLKTCAGYGMTEEEFKNLMFAYIDLYSEIFEEFVKARHDNH